MMKRGARWRRFEFGFPFFCFGRPFRFHFGIHGPRGFPRREEYLNMLEEYREELKEYKEEIEEELKEVEKEIEKLKGAS
jgi:hypothetical protein